MREQRRDSSLRGRRINSINEQILVVPHQAKRTSSYQDTMRAISQIRDELHQLSAFSGSNFEFNLWQLPETDELYNFKYYFPKHNAERLETKMAKDSLLNNISTMKVINKKIDKQ